MAGMAFFRGGSYLRGAAVLLLATMAIASCRAMAETAVAETAAQSAASDAGFSAAKLDRIDQYFANEIAGGQIPGAIVLVQRHGKPAYFRCFGVRDPASGLAMTPETIFRIFSMSKPITAVTAMMLVDQGRLKLDDPLSSYIPSFANVKVGVETKGDDGAPRLDLVPLQRPITIEDLLRQSSGITYGFYGETLVRKEYVKADLFRTPIDNTIFAERIAQLPLAEQPGTLWDYGHSMDILGRVIEIVSGHSLYQTEKAMLFDPLEMSDTAYYVADPAKFPLIAQPMPNDKTFVAAMERQVRLPTTWEAGGSGLVSTVGDYAKFAQMLLEGGTLDGRRYLSAAAFKRMTTNDIEPVTAVKRGPFYFPGEGFGYGLGFGVRIERGEHDPPGSIGEFKWDGAGGTYFFVDPKLDMFVLFMVQSPSQRGRIQPELKKMIYDALAPSERAP
jgi:CubicO group peptidase (beta-lactamase class C family)